MTIRRAIVLSTATFLLAALGVLLYSFWVSPSYSLHQIASAVENHDAERFGKYVDVDQLSAQAVDTLASNTDGLAFAVTQNMRPSLIARFRSALIEGVESGDLSSRTFAGVSGAIRPIRIARVTRRGKVADVALVAVVPRHPREELTLNVQMRDKGTYWQLFRFVNLAETATLLTLLDARSSLATADDERLKTVQEVPVVVTESQQVVTETKGQESVGQLRKVERVVGYKERIFRVPGYVAFDRANRDFHVFGCASITPAMEKVNLRTLEVQGISRNRDCADRPLPYETRKVQEPVTETAMEWVPKRP